MSDYSFHCTRSGTLKWRQSEEQKRQPNEEDKRVKDIILQRELCLGLPQALTYLISIVKGEHFVSLCTVGLRVREKDKSVCVKCTLPANCDCIVLIDWVLFNMIRTRTCLQSGHFWEAWPILPSLSACPPGRAAAFHDVMWLSACSLRPLSAV